MPKPPASKDAMPCLQKRSSKRFDAYLASLLARPGDEPRNEEQARERSKAKREAKREAKRNVTAPPALAEKAAPIALSEEQEKMEEGKANDTSPTAALGLLKSPRAKAALLNQFERSMESQDETCIAMEELNELSEKLPAQAGHTSRALARMSPDDRGETLAAMSPTARATSTLGMSPEERVGTPMSHEHRANSLAALCPTERALDLGLMDVEGRVLQLEAMPIPRRGESILAMPSALRKPTLTGLSGGKSTAAMLSGMSHRDRLTVLGDLTPPPTTASRGLRDQFGRVMELQRAAIASEGASGGKQAADAVREAMEVYCAALPEVPRKARRLVAEEEVTPTGTSLALGVGVEQGIPQEVPSGPLGKVARWRKHAEATLLCESLRLALVGVWLMERWRERVKRSTLLANLAHLRSLCLESAAVGSWQAGRQASKRAGMLGQLRLRCVETAAFERWRHASHRSGNLESIRVLLAATAACERWRGSFRLHERWEALHNVAKQQRLLDLTRAVDGWYGSVLTHQRLEVLRQIGRHRQAQRHWELLGQVETLIKRWRRKSHGWHRALERSRAMAEWTSEANALCQGLDATMQRIVEYRERQEHGHQTRWVRVAELERQRELGAATFNAAIYVLRLASSVKRRRQAEGGNGKAAGREPLLPLATEQTADDAVTQA